jgi:soluble lytic murein transglycosylase
LYRLGLLIFSLSACGAGRVLDLPRERAGELLKNGDIRFILDADVSRLGEIKGLHPAAPFYAGLLAEARQMESVAAALFTAALESRSPRVREGAAEKLLPVLLEGEDRNLAEALVRLIRRDGPPSNMAEAGLKIAVPYVLGRFEVPAALPGEAPLLRALRLPGALRKAGAGADLSPGAAELFLSLPASWFSQFPASRVFPWVFAELEEQAPAALKAGERAALAGRLAVAQGAYPQGLALFKEALADPAGTELFFRYPELVGDLGRAFQFAPAEAEGVALFSRWEGFLANSLADGGADGKAEDGVPLLALPADFQPDREALRYRLLYFAGRLERQRERYGSASAFFTRALAFAPDPAQEDACIWYILNVNFRSDPDSLLPLLKLYRSRWHDDHYFADILDQLCRSLTVRGRWTVLEEVFSLIRSGSDGATIGRFAWILGRAFQEGYITSPEAAGYFTIAFENEGTPLYYRVQAAAALGRQINLVSEEAPRRSGDFPHPELMDFLLGFFQFGAGPFAYPYIKAAMAELSIPEQRALAEALYAGERWEDCIRLVSAYMSRLDYRLSRRDMELAYPRPYRDMIEERARETGIDPALFYGLIRTESAFTADIVSWAGAVGLAQLMPETALDMAGRLSRRGGPDYIREGRVELRDPGINLHLGALYLAYLNERMETPMLALLAYNGGMGRIRRWRGAAPGLPPDLFPETIEFSETREYGRKVMTAAAAYGYLYYEVTMEAVIADIHR